ncbi:MAG: type II secretion system protein GspG, partial [Gemmatimonadetes bacterium]|nr:type II secretion system protein GspG [Gemmatimonadota bacterium]
VIAIVASIAVPLAAVMEDRARLQATREELGHLSDALLSYWEDRGAFPDSLPELETGGYVSGQTDPDGYRRDAWHRDYTYARAGLSATLASSGPDFSFGTADDVDLLVTAAAVAREETRDELATIHVALRNYETQRVPALLPDLPSHWDVQGATPGAFSELVAEGLLPNEIRFLTDAWGSTYVYGGTPADYVVSPNL